MTDIEAQIAAIETKARAAGLIRDRGIADLTFNGPGPIEIKGAGISVSLARLEDGNSALVVSDSGVPLSTTTFEGQEVSRFRLEWEKGGGELRYSTTALP